MLRSDPVGSGRVRSDPVGSGRNPTYGGPKTSGRIRSDPVGSGRIRSDPVGIGACTQWMILVLSWVRVTREKL